MFFFIVHSFSLATGQHVSFLKYFPPSERNFHLNISITAVLFFAQIVDSLFGSLFNPTEVLFGPYGYHLIF